MANYGQIFDALLTSQRAAGVTLSGGFAYFYSPGTTTLKTVWADRSKATPAANPYTLSADGTAMLYGDGLYDVKITNSAGVQKFLWEDVALQDASGEFYTLSNYADLPAAVTAIGSTKATLLIPSNTSLSADLTIPATITIQPTNGSVITIASGKTLTINGILIDPGIQCFAGSGSVAGLKESRPEWFGTGTDAVNKARDSVVYGGTVILGKGTYTTISIPDDNGIMWRGAGSGSTILQHVDGSNTPLITNLTGGVAPNAYPYYGYQGITFRAGSQTTALIYFTGRVDSMTKFDDLSFDGNGSLAAYACDGISVLDYLNWTMNKIRWDGLTGWAVKVRAITSYGSAQLSISDFTFDNNENSTVADVRSAWGKGFIYADASGINAIKGNIHLLNGTIEINKLVSSPTAGEIKSIIRLVNNASATYTGQFIIQSTNVQLKVNSALSNAHKDITYISAKTYDVGVILTNFESIGCPTIYNIDTFLSKNPILASISNSTYKYPHYTTDYEPNAYPLRSLQTGNLGRALGRYDSDTKRDAGEYVVGDRALNDSPLNAGGKLGRNFGTTAVNINVGMHNASPTSITVTGAIDTGTKLLTLSAAVPTTIYRGMGIIVAGGAASNAALVTVVNDIDYTTNILTLKDNAGATVSGAALYQIKAELFHVDMVQYIAGSAAPWYGRWNRGDKVLLSDATAGGYIGFVVTSTGTTYATWTTGKAYIAGHLVGYGTNWYMATGAGTSGATPPTHTSGTASDGTVTWQYMGGSVSLTTFKGFGLIQS